jgi:hypothetical protein
MVNFVEGLFGFAATFLVAALWLAFRHRPALARRCAIVGGAAGLLALVLELYLRQTS